MRRQISNDCAVTEVLDALIQDLQMRIPDDHPLERFVNGIWESLYSGIRMDPAEVIGQWQAIESNGR